MQQYSLTNSEQSRDFRGAVSSTPLDKLSSDLVRLVKRAMGNVEEGLRGMEDTKEVKRLRNDFDGTIKRINTEYANTVLHTGEILDKFDKKVNAQEQLLVDAVKDFKWRNKKEQQLLNSIAGRKEDSAIYQRMGSAKYTIYSVIALAIVGLTMTHMDLNFSAYMAMAFVLSGVFIFIVTYFYWKKSIYSTS